MRQFIPILLWDLVKLEIDSLWNMVKLKPDSDWETGLDFDSHDSGNSNLFWTGPRDQTQECGSNDELLP